MATISGEAFAYLLVENYWDEWSKKNWRSTWLRHHLIVQSVRGKMKDNMGGVHQGSLESTAIYWVESL